MNAIGAVSRRVADVGKSIKSSQSIQTSWPWQPAFLLAWSGDQSDAEFCSRHQAIHLLFFGKEILKDLLAAPDCKAGTNPKHPKKCLRFFGPSSQHVVYSPGGGCQLSDVCHFAGQSFQSEKGDGSEFSDTHRYERLQYLGTQPFLFFWYPVFSHTYWRWASAKDFQSLWEDPETALQARPLLRLVVACSVWRGCHCDVRITSLQSHSMWMAACCNLLISTMSANMQGNPVF